MTRFTRQNGIFVPSSVADSLDKRVGSSHRRTLVVGPKGNPLYADREGKIVSEDKVAKFAAYRENLRINVNGGTLGDILIQNKTFEYVNDFGEKVTVDLRKDATAKKQFAAAVGVIKDAAKKHNLDIYDGKTDTLNLSDKQLTEIARFVDDLALSYVDTDAGAYATAQRELNRIARDSYLRKVVGEDKAKDESDEKVVQMPARNAVRARAPSGLGKAGAAAAALFLAAVIGSGCANSMYGSRRSARKYGVTDLADRDIKLDVSLGYAHEGNVYEGDETYDLSKGGVDFAVKGGVLEWYRASGQYLDSNLILDARVVSLNGDGTIEGIGDVNEFNEKYSRFLVGMSQDVYSKDDKDITLKLLLGGEWFGEDVDMDWDVNNISIVNERSGFAGYFGADFRTHELFALGVGYGQSSQEGTQKTDVSSGGNPLSSETVDVDGKHHRLNIYATKWWRDRSGEKFWLGPTKMGFNLNHDELDVFDKKLYEFVIGQQFDINDSLNLYLGGKVLWGSKEQTTSTEDISGSGIRFDITYRF